MKQVPIVSIVVPCYNYGHLLSETLNNIFEQDFQLWECLIIDDGSTDNTSFIANQFVQKDERFRYIYQKNSGLSAARNTGIKNSIGTYIQLLDADDFIQHSKFKSQLAVFKANPEIDIIYSEVRYFYSDSPTTFYLSHDGSDRQWMTFADSDDHENLKSTLISINICVVNAPLIRKDIFAKIGEFNPLLKSVEDWEFWCRCAYSGIKFKFDNSPNSMALVRLHENSMSRSPKGMMEAACVARDTLHKLILAEPQNDLYLERTSKNTQEKAYLHKTLFELYQLEKDKRRALHHLYEFGKIKNERLFVLKQSLKLLFKNTP